MTIVQIYENALGSRIHIEPGIVVDAMYRKKEDHICVVDGEDTIVASYSISENGTSWYVITCQSQIVHKVAFTTEKYMLGYIKRNGIVKYDVDFHNKEWIVWHL